MFKKFHHQVQRTVLASALVTVTSFSQTIQNAHAGIMVDSYEQILYGDMAEGKGVFAPDKTNIKIYDKAGNYRGTIPYAINPQGVADGLFVTMVNPSFGISANHVGYTTDITFGNTKTFIRNDGTLFDGSGTANPFNGNSITDTSEWSRILSKNLKQWRELFLKYLSTNYHEANPDRMIWYKKDYATDFKIDRYMKINVDAVPYEIMNNNDRMKAGDRLLHVGAGSSQMHSREDASKNQSYIYGTPIGGLGIVTYAGDANVYQKQANPNNTTENPDKVLVGYAFKWTFNTTQKNTDVLEQGILGGDSGSPVFWLDPKSNTWKLAGATSSITGFTFGAQTNFIGNMPWVAERIKYYDDPDINLKEGDTLVFHGQNSMNGVGNLHIVAQGTTDIIDANIKADTDRVSKLVDKDIENQVYIITEKNNKRTPEAVKPNLILGTEEEYKNSTYTSTDKIQIVEYKGYAFGYDFTRFGSTSNKNVSDQIIYKNHDLNKVTKNLIINGAGQGKSTLITFSEDVAVNQNTINLGADSITLNSGDFVLKQNPNINDASKQIKSFINAGYIINADASLRYELDGQANDAIHKLGLGTLTIAGKGNQLSPLNVGQGLILLDREGGTATPYLKIASGRAVVRLMREGQLVRNLDNKTNNVAVGFGQNGGILDFNGIEKDQTWIDIYHLDQGATIANLKSGKDNQVTFTFAPNGKRSYLGSFVGNLNLVYKPTDTSTSDKATWMLKNTVDITGDVKLTTKSNLVLGDVRTARGWGQFYDDRYDRVSYVSNTTTLEDSSSLQIGRNTIFSSHINAGANARLEIHNRDKLIAPDNNYPIENQHLVEKTVVDGSITLADSAKAIVEVDAGHVIDIFSDVRGTGTLTLTGKGVINIGGDNTFTGAVKVCETNNTTDNCTTPLNFITKLGEEVTFDSFATPTLPDDFKQSELSKEQANTATSSTTPSYADASNTPATDDFTLYNAKLTLAATGDSTSSSTDTTASTKPTIEQFDYDKHKNWEQDEFTKAEQAENIYVHNTQDKNLEYIPVPDADSLIVNFFSKKALFQNSSSVDTTNAKVVFYTSFADAAQGETVLWDLGNYRGDAFIVKDGDYQLQVKNHNLAGTFFIRAGSVVADSISSHLVIGRDAMFYADARNSLHNVSLHGRVFNAGTIYLTQKETVLPTASYQSTKPTVTPPSIATPSASMTTAVPAPAGSTSTSAPLSGYALDSSTPAANNLTLATTRDSTTNNSISPLSNTMDNGMLVTGTDDSARRNLSTLVIEGDYYGENGKIIYDMSKEITQVHIKGKAAGTTTLVIKDISAVTAAGRESFDILTVDDNIQENAFVLQNGYVSGGIYDYVTKAAGKDIKLVSYINSSTVEVTPNWSVGTGVTAPELPTFDPEKFPITSVGTQEPPTTQPLPELDPSKTPIWSLGGTPPTTEALPEWDITQKPITSVGTQEPPTTQPLPELDPSKTPIWSLGGTPPTTEALPEWDITQKPITSVGTQEPPTTQPLPELDPNKTPIWSLGGTPPTTPALPEWDTTQKPITSVGTQAPPTTSALPELDPSKVQISATGEPLLFPELPYFNPNSVAGSRIINSSVGTLLANRRFISNLNVTPMSLTQRPGFFLSVDRDSESLDFTGADYTSSYQATRTLVGSNFTLLPNLKVGVFANAATATSVIENKVNSATGKVNAMGIGGFAQTQLGDWFEFNGAGQYLYAQSAVEGTHNQSQVLNGGFAAMQVSLTGLSYGNFFTLKPYVLSQAEFTPTSHFVSRLGEELGTITANNWSNALGMQATVSYRGFALEVDAYQTLGQRTTEFNSHYTQDHISASNNNYRVQTTASYQLLPNLKVSSYFNMHGTQRTSGMSLDVQW